MSSDELVLPALTFFAKYDYPGRHATPTVLERYGANHDTHLQQSYLRAKASAFAAIYAILNRSALDLGAIEQIARLHRYRWRMVKNEARKEYLGAERDGRELT
ncbi:hypothetical protein FRC07_001376, partial [Ceratobasidium sp. 392]